MARACAAEVTPGTYDAEDVATMVRQHASALGDVSALLRDVLRCWAGQPQPQSEPPGTACVIPDGEAAVWWQDTAGRVRMLLSRCVAAARRCTIPSSRRYADPLLFCMPMPMPMSPAELLKQRSFAILISHNRSSSMPSALCSRPPMTMKRQPSPPGSRASAPRPAGPTRCCSHVSTPASTTSAPPPPLVMHAAAPRSAGHSWPRQSLLMGSTDSDKLSVCVQGRPRAAHSAGSRSRYYWCITTPGAPQTASVPRVCLVRLG